MTELQATVEFQVELGKFYNVDLFQRGYYQVRAYLKTPPKVPIKVEISLPRNSVGKLVVPASIINGVAVSKAFQILYRNEEVNINDVILFKVHMLVDVNRISECLERADLHLVVELWFTEEEVNSAVDCQEKLQLISQRAAKLHFTATEGLHHHLQLLFDYFHLCVVTVTIHGSLIALHQPYISFAAALAEDVARDTKMKGCLDLSVPKQQKSGNWTSKYDHSTLESVLFGSRPAAPDSPNNKSPSSSARLRHACKVHKNICNILLSSYESLQTCLESYISKLPSFQQIKLEQRMQREHTDCHARLEMLSEIAQSFKSEEDLLETAVTDVAQLCAENVILWQQFLEIVTLMDKVTFTLAKEHHTQRVKRFADGFFFFEFPKQAMLSCYEPSIHGHADQAAVVRNSAYFQSIPPLAVDCNELDGDQTTLPIIFEDIFKDFTAVTEIPKSVDTEDIELAMTNSVDKETILERKDSTKSNATDTSSTHSSDSSPRTRKNRRKFIKNVKPETLKRPSFSVSNPEVTGLIDKPDCNLVGYKKVPNEDTFVVPTSEMRVPPIELGTFSPAPSKLRDENSATHNALQGAFSMPTLLAKGHLKMSATGSMPDLSEGLHNLDSKKSGAPSTGSEPNLTGAAVVATSSANSGMPDSAQNGDTLQERRSSKVSFTEPEVTTCETLSKSENVSTENPAVSISSNNSTVITETVNTNSGEEPGASQSVDKMPQNPGEVDYELLAQSLTQALGEPESDQPSVTGQDDKPTPPDSGQPDNADEKKKADKTQTNCDGGISEASTQAAGGSTSDSDKSGAQCASRTSPNSKLTKLESVESTSSDSQFTVLELLKSEYDKNEADNSKNNYENKDGASSNSDFMKNGLIWPDDANLSNGEEVAPTTPPRPRPATASGCCSPCISSSSHTLVSTSGPAVTAQPGHLSVSHSVPELGALHHKAVTNSKLVSPVANKTLSFISAKEELKRLLKYHGHLYSDFQYQSSTLPYFWTPEDSYSSDEGLHLIVCVHGLDGNSADLRLVRTYLELAMPGQKVDFLMSERNQADTFADFEVMTDRLVAEVLYHMETFAMNPSKISFIGHSLGNLIIRSALSRPEMALLLPKLHTFLSLSGPHLGTLYNNSGLVNMGMWFMQKWKKSGSLLQLSLKDHTDPRQTFLYKLSQKPGLEFFRNILLVGSSQDRYVPFHSSRIELCRASVRDNSNLGAVYNEMVTNILQPILYRSEVTFVRYDVFHALPNTANSLIGRAAHIAVLDSELFIEKFITVSALKYFK